MYSIATMHNLIKFMKTNEAKNTEQLKALSLHNIYLI